VDGRLRGSQRETALEARVTSRSFRPRGSLTGAPLRWGEGEMLALQRRVGNDAVRTLAEGRVVLQRQGAPLAAGADPAVQAAAERAWENEVSNPIAEAYSELAGPRPDYNRASGAIRRALDAVYASGASLPKEDSRRVHANYLIDDLNIARTHVEAKLGTSTDEQAADLLRGAYDQAEAYGQELGVVTEPSVLASEVVVTP
jgi:hypothetical protein